MAINYSGTRPAPLVAKAVYQYTDAEIEYVGPQLMISVPEQAGTLPQVQREGLMPSGGSAGTDSKRAPGSAYKRGAIGAEGVAYACEGHGHEVPMPKEHQAIYGGYFNTLVAGARKGRMQLLAELELRLAALMLSTATFTGSSLTTDYSGAPWATAGSDILGQVAAGKEKVRKNTGMAANAVIMGPVLYRHCWSTNTAIKGKFSGLSLATPQMIRAHLAELFDVQYVIVGGAVYNSAAEGATMVPTDAWGEQYVQVCRIATGQTPDAPSVARVPAWQAMGAGTDVAISTYDEPQTKSTVVQCDLYTDEIIVDEYFGHMLKVKA